MAVTDTCMMHSSAGIDRILLDLMLRSTVSFKSAANLTAFLAHLIQDWRYSAYSVKDFLVKHNKHGEMTVSPAFIEPRQKACLPRKIQGREVHMHPLIDETTCEMHRLNTRYRLKCLEMRVNSVAEVRIYQHGHRIDMCCWYSSATFVYVDSTQSNNHLTAVTSACKDGPFWTKYASNLVTNIRDATYFIKNWCLTFGHCVLHKLQVASRPHSSA